jgi:ribonucleoside-diphosphate reductase alpha chain
MARERLEATRSGRTLHFVIITRDDERQRVVEVDGYVQTGEFPDGRLGEVFVRTGGAGSTQPMLDQWAIAFSIALQLGADVEALCNKFRASRFAPSGAVLGVEGIRRCTSPLDLICRWLLAKYGKAAE